MNRDLPSMIAALTVTAYWLGVAVMDFKRRLQRGNSASGLVPRKLSEKLIWPIWAAVVLIWLVTPWRTINLGRGVWRLPDWSTQTEWGFALRMLSAAIGVACLLATIHCWRRMGKNWSVAVVPGERNELVTTGLFSLVRHPIYALSVLLMFSTALVAPVWPMIAAVTAHWLLMQYKAHGEETFMLSLHGQAYGDYCQRTGRFLPRLSG